MKGRDGAKHAERDRLSDLLKQYPCMSTAKGCFMESISDDLADYLIANNVTLPLVERKQILYVLHGWKILEYEVEHLYYEHDMWCYKCRNDNIKGHRTHTFYDHELGYLFFLSKKEALQAIAEYKNDPYITHCGNNPPPLYYEKQ